MFHSEMHVSKTFLLSLSDSLYSLTRAPQDLLHYWGFRCKDCNQKDTVAMVLAGQIRERLRRRTC
jgi:hypothetical protein